MGGEAEAKWDCLRSQNNWGSEVGFNLILQAPCTSSLFPLLSKCALSLSGLKAQLLETVNDFHSNLLNGARVGHRVWKTGFLPSEGLNPSLSWKRWVPEKLFLPPGLLAYGEVQGSDVTPFTAMGFSLSRASPISGSYYIPLGIAIIDMVTLGQSRCLWPLSKMPNIWDKWMFALGQFLYFLHLTILSRYSMNVDRINQLAWSSDIVSILVEETESLTGYMTCPISEARNQKDDDLFQAMTYCDFS